MEQMMTIDGLKETLEQLCWQKGVSTFKLVEHFKSGDNNFIVEHLQMEIEGDFVVCTDDEYVLLNNECRISSFLIGSLLSIHKVLSNKFSCELEFKGGSVLIVAL